PLGERVLRSHLVEARGAHLRDTAGPEILDEGETVAVRHLGELRRGRTLREADDAVVARVDAQQEPRPLGDRALVVRGARAVRRAHLAQRAARALEHLGDAKAAADLDELAPRDDHL